MGLFGKLFEKKYCDICGGEIGLLGNRKLEDGNLCKNCAAKLSPWFSDRRKSTVEQIRQQLAYREENREKVAQFRPTRYLGGNTHVLLDEDNNTFAVTSEKNYQDANPDILDFSQVTGCKLDINEHRNELKRKDKDGNSVSFVPPRYEYEYDFYIEINVNHPYFNEIRFQLNDSTITVTPPPGSTNQTVASFARSNLEYQECQRMGNEITRALTQARQQVRRQAAAAAAPKKAVTCPWCGATTTPDSSGCCEYCGGSVKA